jgi:hypothetical protein
MGIEDLTRNMKCGDCLDFEKRHPNVKVHCDHIQVWEFG